MLELLTSKVGLGVMFFAILAGGVGIGVQQLRVSKLQSKLAVEHAHGLVLQAQIDAQNTGLLALKRAADDQTERSAKASKASSAALLAAQRRADAIAAQPVPVDCPAAIKFLVDDARTGQ